MLEYFWIKEKYKKEIKRLNLNEEDEMRLIKELCNLADVFLESPFFENNEITLNQDAK